MCKDYASFLVTLTPIEMNDHTTTCKLIVEILDLSPISPSLKPLITGLLRPPSIHGPPQLHEAY